MDILQWAKDRHEFWWKHLLENAKYPEKFDITVPTLEFTYNKSGCAGTGSYDGCAYNANYLIEFKEDFDSTIAHEICHVFISRLRVYSLHIKRMKGGHCPLFFYIFNVVCGVQHYKYHSYGAPKLTEEAKILRKYKKLQVLINKSAINEDC